MQVRHQDHAQGLPPLHGLVDGDLVVRGLQIPGPDHAGDAQADHDDETEPAGEDEMFLVKQVFFPGEVGALEHQAQKARNAHRHDQINEHAQPDIADALEHSLERRDRQQKRREQTQRHKGVTDHQPELYLLFVKDAMAGFHPPQDPAEQVPADE